MVYKRRREEPVPESDEDSDLDEDEKEALAAFKNEGFNKDMEEKEAQRLKKVEDELDAKEKEKERAEQEEIEMRKKQKLAESIVNAAPPQVKKEDAPPLPTSPAPEGGPPEEWSDHPNFKTKLCVRWQAGGCNFGDRCGFAHGPSDVRQHMSCKGDAFVPPLPLTQPIVMNQATYTDMAHHQMALHAHHAAHQAGMQAGMQAGIYPPAQYHQVLPPMGVQQQPPPGGIYPPAQYHQALPPMGHQNSPAVGYYQPQAPAYSGAPQMQHHATSCHPQSHVQMPVHMPPAPGSIQHASNGHSIPLPPIPLPPPPVHAERHVPPPPPPPAQINQFR